jgi:hypothetical protein
MAPKRMLPEVDPIQDADEVRTLLPDEMGAVGGGDFSDGMDDGTTQP